PAIVGNAALNGFQADSTSTPRTRSFALFGQADWNISDALTLTTGLRFTHEKKDGTFNQYWAAGDDLSGLAPDERTAATAIRSQFNPVTNISTNFSDNSLSGLVTLRWKLD